MRVQRKLLLAASFLSTVGLAGTITTSAKASAAAVYVGYLDGLRGGTDFPNPYTVGGTFTTGGSTYTISTVLGDVNDAIDAGGIMLLNTGSTNMVINGLDVSNVGSSAGHFAIWGGSFTLAAGKGAIFTSTSNYNFDTSDYSSAALQVGFDPNTNNCSVGAIAATLACISSAAKVMFTLDGVNAAFNDTGHVLDTGGYDTANYNHFHTGGGGVALSNTNESLNWRAIGTTGLDDPGGVRGGVPEPASWAMMVLGFGGLGAVLRRRRQVTLTA